MEIVPPSQPTARAVPVFFRAVLAVFCVVFLAAPKPLTINPESAEIAPELPLADLHLHPDISFAPSKALDRMNRNNVRWGGGGVLTWPNYVAGRRDVWLAYSRILGERFIPFAGQSELNRIYQVSGADGMADANNPGIREFLGQLEQDLTAKRVKGVGTYFINNSRTDDRKAFRRKVPGNATAVRAIFALVARFHSVLRIHMEPDRDSIAAFEPVMASDRRGRVLWNQCGSTTTAAEVRALMDRNPNLFCELSWRFPPVTRPNLASRNVFDNYGPRPDWLELMEDFPDRFMFGNDGHADAQYDGAAQAFRRNLLPYLKPATARRIAYENAQRVFDLK